MQDEYVESLFKAVGGVERMADSIEKTGNYIRDNGTTVEKMVTLHYLKEVHAALDEQVKRIYHVKDMFDKNVCPGALLGGDTPRISVDSVGKNFSVQTKYSASIINKELGFQWLRERGDGDLITETVNASTLSSYLKNLVIEEGVDPPEEIFKFSSYNTTGVTSYKGKVK